MKHVQILHFAILITILAGGIAAFYYVRPDVTLQLLVGIVTSVAYVCWGIIHHIIRQDLHRKIVIEYMLIGAIAIVLLLTILGF
jgi:hypothetical protein